MIEVSCQPKISIDAYGRVWDSGLPVQEPGPSVVRYESNGDVVARATDVDDVAAGLPQESASAFMNGRER